MNETNENKKTRSDYCKTVELIDGYIIIINATGMELKVKTSGEKDNFKSLGFPSSYKSLFKLMTKHIQLKKLKKNNTIKDLYDIIQESNKKLDKICKLLGE